MKRSKCIFDAAARPCCRCTSTAEPIPSLKRPLRPRGQVLTARGRRAVRYSRRGAAGRSGAARTSRAPGRRPECASASARGPLVPEITATSFGPGREPGVSRFRPAARPQRGRGTGPRRTAPLPPGRSPSIVWRGPAHADDEPARFPRPAQRTGARGTCSSQLGSPPHARCARGRGPRSTGRMWHSGARAAVGTDTPPVRCDPVGRCECRPDRRSVSVLPARAVAGLASGLPGGVDSSRGALLQIPDTRCGRFYRVTDSHNPSPDRLLRAVPGGA